MGLYADVMHNMKGNGKRAWAQREEMQALLKMRMSLDIEKGASTYWQFWSLVSGDRE